MGCWWRNRLDERTRGVQTSVDRRTNKSWRCFGPRSHCKGDPSDLLKFVTTNSQAIRTIQVIKDKTIKSECQDLTGFLKTWATWTRSSRGETPLLIEKAKKAQKSFLNFQEKYYLTELGQKFQRKSEKKFELMMLWLLLDFQVEISTVPPCFELKKNLQLLNVSWMFKTEFWKGLIFGSAKLSEIYQKKSKSRFLTDISLIFSHFFLLFLHQGSDQILGEQIELLEMFKDTSIENYRSRNKLSRLHR